MKKKRLSERLQLFGKGREHYLEFLRNLTPQILLLSLAFLLGALLDFTHFDSVNQLRILMICIFLGSFALAFYANFSLFYSKCFAEWELWLNYQKTSIAYQGIKGYRGIMALFKAIWRHKWVEFVEVGAVICFQVIALVAVLVMSIYSAASIWRNNHEKGANISIERTATGKPASSAYVKH